MVDRRVEGEIKGGIKGGIKGEMTFHNSLYINQLSRREGGIDDFLHKTGGDETDLFDYYKYAIQLA